MLKKIACSTLVLLSLAGCGHHQHWVGPAVVGGVIGYGMANSQPRVIVDSPYCRQQYEQRVQGCDLKFRNDPYYGRRHYGSCVDQAKYAWDACTGYHR